MEGFHNEFDAFAYYSDDKYISIQVFHMRQGKIIERNGYLYDLTDAKEQPSNSAYVTKIVEYPSTLVNLGFNIEDALPSGDASENFFLDLDNDLAEANLNI